MTTIAEANESSSPCEESGSNESLSSGNVFESDKQDLDVHKTNQKNADKTTDELLSQIPTSIIMESVLS